MPKASIPPKPLGVPALRSKDTRPLPSISPPSIPPPLCKIPQRKGIRNLPRDPSPDSKRWIVEGGRNARFGSRGEGGLNVVMMGPNSSNGFHSPRLGGPSTTRRRQHEIEAFTTHLYVGKMIAINGMISKSTFGSRDARPRRVRWIAGHPVGSGSRLPSFARASDAEEMKSEWSRRAVAPRKVALFVEPSPFTYVCGYKNRFCNAIRFLREAGDDVLAIVPEDAETPEPEEYFGAKVVPSKAFRLPWYPVLPLSMPLSPRVYYALKEFKPDVIHASSPGVMVFAAVLFAKMLAVPLVLSYHTHLPKYIPDYTFSWLVKPAWALLRFIHKAADLTLTTSKAMADELAQAGVAAVHALEVWLRGVDSDIFHPKHKCQEMRARLTSGRPEAPCVVHVGRLGAEKNLQYLKKIMQEVRKTHPDAQLALVGDGPFRQNLERHFSSCKWVHFLGMLRGQELSAAYASGDVFVMPSESETLGFVVLEAMAAGLPVVAVEAGGIPDIITRNGEVGFLYKSGDSLGAADTISKLLSCSKLRQQVGLEARREVENWDWRAATKHLRESQYARAITNFNARRARQQTEMHPSYAT